MVWGWTISNDDRINRCKGLLHHHPNTNQRATLTLHCSFVPSSIDSLLFLVMYGNSLGASDTLWGSVVVFLVYLVQWIFDVHVLMMLSWGYSLAQLLECILFITYSIYFSNISNFYVLSAQFLFSISSFLFLDFLNEENFLHNSGYSMPVA